MQQLGERLRSIYSEQCILSAFLCSVILIILYCSNVILPLVFLSYFVCVVYVSHYFIHFGLSFKVGKISPHKPMAFGQIALLYQLNIV